MNLLNWNCRDLGNQHIVRILGEVLKTHKSDLVFLSETLSVSNKIEDISSMFGFTNYFSVDRQEIRGGIAVLWKHTMACEVVDSSSHIDILILENNSRSCPLTCYYGFPERERSAEVWDNSVY